MDYIPEELMKEVFRHYRMDVDGIHGIAHWGRVLENGLMLSEHTGADIAVVTYFALLHDSQRTNDGVDFKHGPRAAEFIDDIRDEYLTDLTPDQIDLLADACSLHTEGLTLHDSVTVETCWDSDRLDLNRVCIFPEAEKLCTVTAKDPDVIERCSIAAVNDKKNRYFLKLQEIYGCRCWQ